MTKITTPDRYVEQVLQASRATYGKPRREVEAALARRAVAAGGLYSVVRSIDDVIALGL